MSRPLTPVYRSLSLLAMCILLTCSFSACSGSDSGGAEQQSGGTGDPYLDTLPPGTGGVAFQIVWEQPSSGAKAAQFTPSFNSCNDYALGTISATVSNGTTTVTKSWPCSAHQGTIVAVPAGTNYTLRVDGIASGTTTTTWSGQKSPVTVTAGLITNAGSVAMNYIGTDSTIPAVTSIGPKSNPTITTNLPVTDRINIVFSKPMAISTVTSTNIALLSGGTTTVAGKVIYDGTSNTAAFISSANLAYNTQYVLNVVSCVTSSCITDTGGHTLASTPTKTFTTEVAPISAPTATPSGVTATAGNGQVTLDWLASSGSTSYNVYYGSAASCPTTTTAAVLANTYLTGVKAPAVHVGLSINTTYCYIITAVNSFGESLASAQVTTTPTFPATNPLPPASPVTVSYDNPVPNQNTITWPAVAGATGYNLYWSTSPITPDTTTADHVIRYVTSPYTHTGVTSGQNYCYLVTAMNSVGESAPSMQFCNPGSIFISW